MKKLLFLFILFLGISIIGLAAGTDPAPQTVPYSQDFSGLAHTANTYPAGWQGWTISTSPGASFNTAAPTADRTLTASSTANTTSGNVHNYNGKIGFLNSSSLDLSLVLAINTTSLTGVGVTYDIMTIRNPYDGGSNTRINEVTLQYRVGTTGTFTNLTGIEYQNNTTTQTTAVTTPQNLLTKTITLPGACDNQAIVQLRWASRQVSGAGSRPSFAVDNISIAVTSTPTISVVPSTLSDFTYVEGNGPSTPAKTYVLSGSNLTLPSGDITITPSTNYEVSLNGTTFSTTPITQSYTGGTLGNTTVSVRLIQGLSAGTYNGTIGNSGGGVTTPVNVTCSGSVTPATPTPTITVGTIASFGNQTVNTLSNEKTYNVSGANLTGDIIITPPTGFQISTGTGVLFTATNPITLTQSGGTVASTPIYVKFAPTLVQAYSDVITHTSTGATQQDVAVSGTGIAAAPGLPLFDNFNYADNSLLTANGWTAHNGGGTNPIAVGASNGLTYAGYSGVGGVTGAVEGNAAKLVNTGEDVSNIFATVSSGSLYYSFMVNVTVGTAGYYIHLGGSTSAFAARVFVKPSATSGKINFGLSNTSTASYATTPTDYDLSTTYLIIVKYDVSTTGAASLWVKALGVPTSETAAGTPEHTTTGTGQATIDRVCLRQYDAAQRIVVDGLRVGSTWEVILPPPAATPIISVAPSSLNGFGYVFGATTSPSQQYNLSGENLTGFPGDITISAASTNYEVSLNNIDFYDTRTVGYSSGTLASTPIHVRLKLGLGVATYNGELIAHTGGGATQVNVTCNGEVTAASANTVNIAPGGSVLEPFAIGTSATATLPTGWRVDKLAAIRTLGTYAAAVTATERSAGDGMSPTASNGIYNYAAGDPATSTERAVGGLSSSSASQSVNVYAKVHNTGTGSIPSLIIGYDVEKYRQGFNASGFSVQMYYSTDDITYTSAGTDFLTSFIADPGPTNDGYTPAPGETQSVSTKTLGVSMAPGSDLYLAWNYSVTSPGVITSNAQALGIDNVSIVAGTASVVALPTFAPPAGSYYTTQNIVLNCTTPGATIHYTTNGSDPDESSPVYPTTPIQLNSGSGTTVVKARAYLSGSDPSAIATASYFLPSVIEVSNIAALRAGIVGAQVYRLTGEAVVSYFRSLYGTTKIAYVQDATAAIVVYDNPTIMNTYLIGDGITGLTGRLVDYNGMLELTPVTNPGTPTHQGLTITPEVKTLASLTSADQAKLVKIVDATFTGATGNFVSNVKYPIADISGSQQFRTIFTEADYLGSPVPTAPVNIVAIVTQEIDTIQLTSRSAADITFAAPLWSSGYPKAENATPNGFTAKVKINTAGTSYLVVLPSGATAPTSAQVKAGQDATGTPVAVNLAGTIACAAGNTEYILVMAGLSSSTTYNVYFVAEASSQLQVSPVMVPLTTASGSTAPVIVSPTVTNITETSAVLGGNILADGGSAITERGTVWSTISPVTIDDHKLPEGSNTIGVFSHLRESITTGVTIYFAAYATNGVGTSLTTEGSFITLVDEPTNHPQNFTAGTTTTTSIPLSWTDALASLGDVPATGYLIKGSSVSFEDIVNPVDGVPETDGLLVHNVAQGIQHDTMTGLTPGVTYFFKIYPYNSIGGTSVNYKIVPDAPSVSATTLILLYENFDYTIGTYVGGEAGAPAGTTSNNWTVHSGIGIAIPVVEGTLSYPGLAPGTGNKISISAGTAKDINRVLSTTSTVAYYSALINVLDSTQLKTTNDYFMHFGATSGASISVFGARLGIVKVNIPATGYRLSIQNTSGGTPTYTQFAQDLAFGTSYLVVVKYDRGVSPTVATLWVNPTELGGEEPTGSVSNNSGSGTFSNFASMCIRNTANTPKAEYDEIRVGTTFAQVTPQGSTNKTLSLTSLFTEGLYAGSGTLNPSYNEFGLQFQADTADMITVQLHNELNYADMKYSIPAALSYTGTSTVQIPAEWDEHYYVTIKHRNSIETTSAIAVDFAGSTINYAFDLQSQAYGDNMGLMIDGAAVFFGGDCNQDGLVDGSDLSDIGNLADYAASGYLSEDINGDGLIDGSDLSITGNNADFAIGSILP